MNAFFESPALVDLRNSNPALAELVQRGFMTEDDTGLPYFTGYRYKTLYDWDQYFEGLMLLYLGLPPDSLINAVKIFLAHQRADGFIARSVPSTPGHDHEHVKPFLAQVALLVYHASGEHAWLTGSDLMPRLVAYLDYWLTAMDGDGNGLSEWMSAPHTGMDNHHERAGFWRDRVSEGVDLNCFLVRECRAMAHLCELAGDRTGATKFREESEARAALIRERMWCEEDGFFYDLNARFSIDENGNPKRRTFSTDDVESDSLFSSKTLLGSAMNGEWKAWAPSVKSALAGNPPWIRQKTIAGFAPLWARVASPEQARRLISDHLLNPREFWTPYPVSTQSRDSRWYSTGSHPTDAGCNWRANVWIPTNYMIYHGLRWYGEKTIASTLARQTVRMVNAAGNREYYCSETGAGCGLDPFWGWSLLAHFIEFEETCDLTPNDFTA